MKTERFFDESQMQSEVKSAIVSKYFWAWAKVIIPTAKKWNNRIAYIDLFAGPGRYKDGTKSTPLLVLEKAIEDRDMRNMLVSIFNDKDEDHSKTLEGAIASLPGVDRLRYRPEVYNEEVGERIVTMFERMKLIPTLFFVDPWGYKGLSLRLVNAVLKDWGCDCIFFFNYNRINMGLSNPLVKEHMEALFGAQRASQLRHILEDLDSAHRELLIVEELVQAMEKMGGKFVLPFRFKNDQGNRTSHHLIFVSKNFKGYEIMKEIMAKESSQTNQGVSSFEYNPADARYPRLFNLARPLKDLERLLLEEFAGESLTVSEVYRIHSVGKRYIMSNYKEVLRRMEKKDEIQAEPSAKNRPQDTMADSVVVTFPYIGGV